MSKTIEQTYKKMDQIEHILKRPDMYMGSIETQKHKLYVLNDQKDQLIEQEIELIPGLFKIFDEIIVNSGDNL